MMDERAPSWTRSHLVSFVLAVALIAAAAVFRHDLIAWFGGGGDHARHADPHAAHTGRGAVADVAGGAPMPVHRYDAPARAELERALAAYEIARDLLAHDSTSGLATAGHTAAAALRATETGSPGLPEGLRAHLAEAAAAADRLAQVATLVEARAAFAALSEHVIAAVSADPEVSGQLHVFECSMTEGFNRWLQRDATLANPYQGARMLTCGAEVQLQPAAASAHDHASASGDEIAFYTCPMDTWVEKKTPGKCPVCGMDLIPVTQEELRTGVLRIDHRRRQLIGLRTGLIEKRPMTIEIRAVGRVVYDETRLHDVTLKYDGWIDKLLVNATGQPVRKGQTLFTLYSPELYTAQQEYLLALSQRAAAQSEVAQQRADALLRGATRRLQLWDVSDAQLDRIAEAGAPLEQLAVPSPASGYVVEKNVVEGASVMRGAKLYRIASLDKVWVEADVYEQDIPFAQVGQRANVTLSHLPGRTFEGKIAFVYPYLDSATRTARVRIELPNKELELRPDMYANVELAHDLGERLVVPEAAVIYSGPRRIVFLDIDRERLRPVPIEVGVKAQGFFEVLSGLSEGDRVVTSGNFLLSAESRLKSATGLW